jgi:DNA-binding MarR family transcriptional regulator
VRLTPKGQRLEQTIRDPAQAADEQVAELLGARRYTHLRDALEQLSAHITSHDTT